jgi:hypothetical protein
MGDREENIRGRLSEVRFRQSAIGGQKVICGNGKARDEGRGSEGVAVVSCQRAVVRGHQPATRGRKVKSEKWKVESGKWKWEGEGRGSDLSTINNQQS